MMRILQPVFVILPIKDAKHVQTVFTEGISPALAQFGFEARRVDDQAVRGGIFDAIRREIDLAYFLIADLSFERPNCYYELGYAHALGKPVLLIKNDTTQVHFDVAHQMVHSFGRKRGIKKLIETQIPKFLETPLRASSDNRNGQFGRRSIRNGFILTAKIDECTKRHCLLTFEVSAVGGAKPLKGIVKFYMHRSYTKKVQAIRAKDGVARYEEVTSDGGPWTLGAEVMDTGTRLELDLAAIPGAKPWWYAEAYPQT